MRPCYALLLWLVLVGVSLMGATSACGKDSLEITLPTPTTPVGLVVYVTGEVASPGVYTLPIGASRITDAIEAAGGFTDKADVNSVNLAAPLADGQQVQVPSLEEPTAGGDQGAETTSLININTASLELLQTLSGIGPVKAQAIIDFRLSNGPFQRIEDILQVQGIGEKTFESIRAYITVR